MSPRIHIETSGCAFNVSDSEAMAGVLARAGHEIVGDAESADVLILNTCTVKDRTLLDFRRRLRQLARSGRTGASRRVILAGCIPKAQPDAEFLREYPLLGPDAVAKVDELVGEALRGNATRMFDSGNAPGRNLVPVLRRNPVVEILPIARGCRSACTFCQTRLARGRLISFPPDEILDQARRAIGEGVKFLWVTAQDTGAYGHDTGMPLDELLNRLLELPGDFRIRLGMSSPQWIAERLDPILNLLAHPKMFRFLHVPLQSGSDRVLAHMRRDGGVAEFRKIHDAFRANFPQGSFVTDLIVGYPTESEEDFGLTMQLARELNLSLMNVSKFSPRPGTVAARLPVLDAETVKSRTARLLELMRRNSDATLAGRVGTTAEVTVEQEGRGAFVVGRDPDYRPVHLHPSHLPGTTIRARIVGWEGMHLMGRAEPVPNEPEL